jgi:very-short-patch-repair endonuclease
MLKFDLENYSLIKLNFVKMSLPFEKSFASHPKAIYWSDKNKTIPENVTISSGKIFWFNCIDCGHIIEKTLSSIVRGEWCPYCSKPCKKLCDNKECTFCFNNSFASHKKAQFWSDKNDIIPRNIFKGSSIKYWFNCIDCNHSFDCKLNDVLKKRWCPYCSKPCQKLCDNKECTFCFNNSFASHEKATFWSDKNDISPRYINKSSSKKYIFNCNMCNHNFKSAICDITSGYWCGYCANHRFCDNEECDFCFNNSFASHVKSQYWSDKNDKKPHNIALKSHKKFWFDCIDCNNSFQSIISNISNGSWCPICKNKTERKLHKWLCERYKTQHQCRYDWCSNLETNKYLPFDFEIEPNIIIELDGRQHFEQVRNWKSPELQKKSDLYKIKCAFENGKHIIRIFQEDVWNDKNEWDTKLIEAIQSLKLTTTPSMILVGIEEEYFTENNT